MKTKVSTIIAAIAATAVVIGAGAAGASTPASAPVLTLTPSTVAAGTGFEAVLTGCSVGDTVTFAIKGTDLDTVTATCAAPAPSASADLVAPTLADTYTVTATASTGGAVSASLVVTGGEEPPVDIPSTGSDSAPIVLIGAGLVAAGGAVVSLTRRRARPA